MSSLMLLKTTADKNSDFELIPARQSTPFAIPAVAGTRYSLVELDSHRSPDSLDVRQEGLDLELWNEGALVVKIQNFYSPELGTTFIGVAENSQLSVLASSNQLMDSAAHEASGADDSSWGWWSTIGLGALGAGALAAGRGGDSSGDDSSAPSLSINPLAGPFVSEVQVRVFDAHGNLIGSGDLDTDTGHVVIHVADGYVGPGFVVVTDQNGGNADYLDEATNTQLDLTTELRAMIEVDGTINQSYCVTPLTELAVRHAGFAEGDVPSEVNPLTVQQLLINQQLGALFGIDDVSGEADPVIGGGFDHQDGISAAEYYGEMLAILSGLDSKTGSLQQTLDQLSHNLIRHNGQLILTAEGISLLQSGLNAFLAGPNGGLAPMTTAFLKVPMLAEAESGINSTEQSDGVVIQFFGAVAGDNLRIQWGDQIYTTVVSAADISDEITSITVPADIVLQAGDGNQAVQYKINDQPASMKVLVSVDLTAPSEPTVTLVDSGDNSDQITNQTRVEISVENGATWEFSLDGGSSWEVGTDGGFDLDADTQYNAGDILVRQTDSVGNTSISFSNSQPVVIDQTAPIATILIADHLLTQGESTTVTVQFSEAVTDFTQDDFQVSGATLADVQTADNGLTWTATLTPKPRQELEGQLISLSTDFTDLAGNAPTLSFESEVYRIDTSEIVFLSGSSAPLISENSGAEQIVYQARAEQQTEVGSKIDGLTYSLSGNNAALFSIDAQSGEVILIGNPDHETQSSYSFEVTATDLSGNSTTQTVTLAVNDLDESAPVFISDTAAVAIDENIAAGQVIYTAQATDAADVDDSTDTSGQLTYSLSGADAEFFTINSATGVVTLTDSPNHEDKSVYSVDITTTDSNGNQDTKTVSLSINDLDESAPTFMSGTVATTIDEHSGAGQVIYTAQATDIADIDDETDTSGQLTYRLFGKDAGAFSIDAQTGEVTLIGNPNHESQASYHFDITATDLAGNATTQTVTLSINDLDESRPFFTSSTTATAIDENSGAGQVIYTATATDTADIDDATDISIELVYSLSSADVALFSIDAQSGEVTLIGNPDHETQSNHRFDVNATDLAGNVTAQTVMLSINDLDESAPVFISGTTATAIDENIGAGQVIYTAQATDTADIYDATNTSSELVYSLSGTDAVLFSINAQVGEVTLIGNPNHEVQSSYAFDVTATDLAGNATTQTVTLSIDDLDESRPVFTSSTTATAIDENSGAGQVIYTAQVMDTADIDDDTDTTSELTYSLSGTDAALFSIDAQSDEVTLIGDPDHETQSSYIFDVIATDLAGNATTQTVMLAINDLDESVPVFTSGTTAAAIDENSGAGQIVYTAVATDTADLDDATDISSELTYSLSGADAALFSIDAQSGDVTLLGDPDHETQSSYVFDVTATDLAGNSTTQTVTLAISDLDESAPVFTSGTTADAIDENSGEGQVIYTAVATDTADIDDDTDTSSKLTYSLSGTDAALFSINEQVGEVTLIGNPNHETQSSYSFDVTATDLAGNATTQTVTLGVNDLDESSPVFTSGTTATAIDENSGASQIVYTAIATDTADIDDDTDTSSALTYGLGGTDAALFSIDTQSGEVTLVGNPDHETQSSYSFDVTATDLAGNATTQTVTLGINDLDESHPVFTSSTTATTINENSGTGQVIYTAQATDTADVDDASDTSSELSYSLSGTDAVLFSIDTQTGEVTLIGNPNHEAQSSYAFDVTATDLAGNATTQTVTLSINDLDESAPLFTSGATTDAINENSGTEQVIYTAQATDTADVDDNTDTSSELVYSLSGTDAALFSIDRISGEVTLLGNPNHETQSSYSFDVTATDLAGNATTQTVTLSINDLDESIPVFTSGATAAAIDENFGAGQIVYTAVATDTADIDDASDTSNELTYSLSGTDAALFSIDAQSGAVTLIGDSDHENQSSYSFDVTATDLAGNATTQTVTLVINDLDESVPVFTSGTTAAAIDENSGEGQVIYTAVATDTADIDDDTDTSSELVYSLSGAEAALFSIDTQSGEVTLVGNPDHETQSSYSFDVTATDLAGNATTQTVTLGINDLDESRPVFTSGMTADAIDENSGAGQAIYTAQAMDTADIDDATDTSSELSYSLSGADAALFSIDAQSGEMTLIGDPDHEIQSSYSFDVTATDLAGNATTQTVTLAINDLDESVPVFTSGTTAAAIDENSGTGQVIYTAQATDTADIDDASDTSGELIYSLSGTDAALFSIDTQTGEVTLIGDPDHETQSSYVFDVTATDLAGNATTQTVTLDINDLDESAPTFASGTTATADAIDENSGAGQIVYTAVATDTADIDDDTDTSAQLTYSLSGTDAALFSIDAQTGDVTLVGNPDHETQSSYAFDVTATDLAGNDTTQTVTLGINDLDESRPVFTSGTTADAIDENFGAGQVIYTAQAMNTADIDDDTETTSELTYSLGGTDAALFGIDAQSGEVTLIGDPDHESQFSYAFDVTATDLAGNATTQTVMLAINDLDESVPVFTSGTTAAAIDENSGAGQIVYTAVATDTADLDDATDISSELTYSLSGADAALFSIDAQSGAVTLIGDPDHETQSSYSFDVTATDLAGNATTQAVMLGINDLDESSPVFDYEVFNTSGTLTQQNSHDDHIVTLQAGINYNISLRGSPTGDGTLSDPYLKGILDINGHLIDGTQNDDGGEGLNASLQFMPTVSGDYTIRAGRYGDTTGTYTLSVKRDVGSITLALEENSGAGQVIYLATAVDTADIDEDTETSSDITYALAGVDAGYFSIDSETGTVTLLDNPDYETKASYDVQIVATDSAGNSSSESLLLNIVDLDEAPRITSPATAVAIDENSGAGQVVYVATANVPGVVFSLEGADADAFSIDAISGEITLLADPDADTQNSYSFTVVITHENGESSAKPITFGINDRDDSKPIFTAGTRLGSGGFIVTWASEHQDGSHSDIYAQRYDSTGGAVGNEFQINTYSTDNQFNPAITELLDGGFVVTWTSVGQDGDGYGIYGQRYDSDANAVGSEFLVNTYTPAYQFDSKIIALPDGGFVVVWVSDGFYDQIGDIYGQRFDSAGYKVGAEFEINTFWAVDQQMPSIAALSDGGFVVTWYSGGGHDSDFGKGVFAQRYSSYGEAVGGEFQVNTYTVNDQSAPSVTGLPTGGFVVTWESYGQDGSHNGIYAQRYDTDGSAVGNEFQVNTHTIRNQEHSSVTALLAGGFVVVWDSEHQDGMDKGIYGQLFDAAGNTLGSEFKINEYTASDQYQPSITALDDGGFVVTWASNTQDGSGYGVYAQRYNSAGNVVGSEFLVNTHTGSHQTQPDVAGFMNVFAGSVFVDENSGSNQTVYLASATDTQDTDDVSDNSANITYSLSGTDASHFMLDASSGQLILLDDPDYETRPNYEVVVIATDDSGNSSSQVVRVGVNNLRDTLTITSSDIAKPIEENSGSGQVVYTITSDDDEAIYSITGDDADLFSVDSITGEIILIANPDSDTKGSYHFNVVAQNYYLGREDIKAVTLTIQDLDDSKPYFTTGTQLGDGGFVVTWVSSDQDGQGVDIYGQCYDAAGNTLGQEFRINTHTGNQQNSPSVTTLMDGGFVVTWESYNQDGSGQGVYGQRYDQHGLAAGGEFLINSYTDEDQYSQSITRLSDGGFIVIWRSSGTQNSSDDMAFVGGIYGQRFDANGVRVGSEFSINSSFSGDVLSPSVTELRDGGFVAVWSFDDFSSGAGRRTMAQRYTADGAMIGNEFQVGTGLTVGNVLPQIAGLANGGFVVVWEGIISSPDSSDSGTDIWGQFYDIDGTPVGNEFRINTINEFDQSNSSITALVNGGFVVAWESKDSSGMWAELHGQLFDHDGNKAGPGFYIETASGEHYEKPAISALDNGGFIVTWGGSLHGETVIYGQRYDINGNSVGPQFLINTNIDSHYGQSDVSGFARMFGVHVQVNEHSGDNQVMYIADAADTMDVDSDVDNSAAVSYSLSGADAQHFDLNVSTGELTLRENPDYKTQSIYNVVITASDGAANFCRQNVTIEVNQPDDGPEITSGNTALAIDENSGSGQVVYVITSDDENATYSVSGDDAEYFDVDHNTGEVILKTNPDADIKASYSIEVIATTQNGLSSSQTVGMEINDLDDSYPLFVSDTSLGNGGFVVTWASYGQDGYSDGVYGQRYDINGNALGDEFQVNTYTDSVQNMPSVTTLIDGGFVVTWSSHQGSQLVRDIYAQRYDVDGSPVGAEFKINTTSVSSSHSPSIAYLTDGGFVVVWENIAYNRFYGQRYDRSGQAVDGEFWIDRSNLYGQKNPSVSALSEGGFIITWEVNVSEEDGYELYGQLYDSNGDVIGDEIHINTYTHYDQSSSIVTGLADGGFVVTWESYKQDGSHNGIFSQIYDTTGNKFGDEFQVNTFTHNHQDNTSVTALLFGGFVVTWDSSGQDGSGEGVYGQLFDTSGAAIGTEFRINTHTRNNQHQSSVTALADGGFVVTWSSSQDGSGYGVYGQRYDQHGNTIGDEFQVNTYTTGDQDEPDVSGFVQIFGEQVSVGENSGANQVVYTANATDTLDTDDDTDNSASVIYSLSGTDADHFSLNTISGELALLDNPDYETQSAYNVVITATDDSGNSSNQIVKVAVNNLDETAPVFTSGTTATPVAENGVAMAVYTIATNDPNATYTLGGVDAAVFTLTNGVVSFNGGADFETRSSYEFEITATDDAGNQSIQTVTMSVNDLDEVAPVFTSGNTATEVDENGEAAAVYTIATDDPNATFILGGVDAASFTLNNDVVSFNGGADFEDQSSYEFTITATDDAGNQSIQTVTMAVLKPVNDSTLSFVDPEAGRFVATWSHDDVAVYGQQFDEQGERTGDAFRASSTFDLESRFNGELVALADGGFVAIWVADEQDTTGLGLVGQRYAADGTRMGGEFIINTEGFHDQKNPAVASLSDGGFVVSWESYHSSNVVSESNYEIIARRFDANAQPQGNEFRVNTRNGGDQKQSDVTALSDGGFVIVWTSEDSDGSGYGVYGQRYDADGQTSGREFLVNLYRANDQDQPVVAALSDGGFMVAWVSEGQDESVAYSNLYAQRFDADGHPVGMAERVNSHTEGDQNSPDAISLMDGSVVMVWQSYEQDGSGSGIYGQRFDALGQAVGHEFQINTHTDNHQFRASLTPLDDGGFMVAWTSTEQDGDQNGVYAQRFDAHGNRVGDEFALNETGQGNQSAAAIIGLTDTTDGAVSLTLEENSGAGQVIYTPTVTDGSGTAPDVTFSLSGADVSAFEIDTSTGVITLIANPDYEMKSVYEVDIIATDDAGDQAHQRLTVTVQEPPSGVTELSFVDPEAGRFVATWSHDDVAVYGQQFDEQGERTGDAFRASSTFDLKSRFNDELVALADGGFVAIWVADEQDTTGLGLVGQRYAADGTRMGGEFIINTEGFHDQKNPAVASLSDGGFVVSWESYHSSNVVSESNYEIIARRFDANVQPQGNEFRVNTRNGGDQKQSDVTALSDGGFVIVWTSEDSDGSGYGVYGQRYDADGQASGREFLVNLYRANDQDQPVVAALSDGGFMVAWVSEGQDESVAYSNLYAQRFDADGHPVGMAERVNSHTEGEQNTPEAISLMDGSVVMVWQSYEQDGSGSGIYGQRFDALGQAVGHEFRINTHTDNHQSRASLTPLDDGGFMVAWTSTEQDGDQNGVYAQRFDAHGNRVGDEFALNEAGQGNQSAAAIIGLTDTTDGAVSLTLEENSGAGQVIYTPTVTDGSGTAPDVTFSLSGADVSAFEIDTSTGAIILIANPDYEMKPGYDVVITASDSVGDSVSQTITVEVTDLDERPTITSGNTAMTIDENSGSGQLVYTITSNYSDVIYSLSGDDADSFHVDSNTGEVIILSNPDADVKSSYQFNVIATDQNGQSDIQSITMDIQDLDDSKPLFTSGNILGTGGFVVTWASSGQDGSYDGIYGQRFSNDGSVLGSEFQINTYITHDQQEPSVTALRDGGFVVTWASFEQDGSHDGIYGQRYDQDGIAIGAEFQVNEYSSNFQQYPEVAGLLDGSFVVTWDSYGQDGSFDGVVVRHYDVNGESIRNESLVNTYTRNYQVTPDVTALSDGGYVIVWASYNTQDGASYGIYGQRFDSEGEQLGAEFRINTYTVIDQTQPSVAGLENGGFVVTWDSAGQDGDDDGVYGQIYNASGEASGGEFHISSHTIDYQEKSSVTALLNGGFVVSWESNNQDGSGEGIYGQLFDHDGSAIGGEFQINTHSTYDQEQASVTALDNGGFVVSWASNAQDGSSYGVYAQRYDSNGNRDGEEFLVNSHTTGSQSQPDVAGFVQVFGGPISVDENSGANQVVYTANATDSLDTDDNTDNSASVTYSLGGIDADHFSLNTTSGELTLLDNPDYEIQSAYNVVITATDDSGNSRSQIVKVDVNNLDDSAPTITSGTIAAALDENSGAGQQIYTVTADDSQDISDGVSYSLSGIDESAFLINEATGAVTLLDDPDYETQANYQFVISATDGAGNRSNQTVTLAINDLNENTGLLSITSPDSVSIDENGGFKGFVYQVTSNTPDVSYSLSGVFSFLFTIDSVTGVVSSVADLDYETQSSYSFDVVATAPSGASVSQTVTVNLNDLDESAPVISGSFESQYQIDNGGFVVTWTSYGQDGSGEGVYGQRYNSDGNTVGSEFQINTYTSSYQRYSSVTALMDGGFVVTWDSADQDSDDYGIFGQRYDSDGNAVGREFRVNTHSTDSQYHSSVTDLVYGGFVVSWYSASWTDGRGVYGRRYDVDGNAVGREFLISDYASGAQAYSQVEGLLDGGFVAIWVSFQRDGYSYGIFGQRYDTDGRAVGSEFLINTSSSRDRYQPSVSALPYGGFVVTWSSDGQDGHGDGVYGQRYDASGNAIGGEFKINTHTRDSQTNSSVTALLNDGFVVTWESENQDGSGKGIYGQLFDADGNTVGSEFRINTTTYSEQYQPSISALEDGGFMVTWTSNDQDSSSTNGIYGQRFDKQGNAVGDEFQINTYIHSDQDEPDVAGLRGAVIEENSGTNVLVYTAQATDTADIDDSTDTSAQVVFSLEGADASVFNIDASTGEVRLIEEADYERQTSYQFDVVATDADGNTDRVSEWLSVSNLDETYIVFDTTTGESTDVDGRTFDADTHYDIYVIVDSDATTPIMNQAWSGGENLGADDRLVFIGDEGVIHTTSGSGTDVSQVMAFGTSDYFFIDDTVAFNWSGNTGEFARVTGSGSEGTDLWSGDSNLPALTVDTATLDQLPDWVTPLS